MAMDMSTMPVQSRMNAGAARQLPLILRAIARVRPPAATVASYKISGGFRQRGGGFSEHAAGPLALL